MSKDIVDRLIEEGSDLSLEAAERIELLRQRAKYWEKETKRVWIPKYFAALQASTVVVMSTTK